MGNTHGKPIVFTDEVNLNHFRLLRVVGKGAFGKVRIVERKDSGLTFALKYIRKDEVVRSESVRNIIRERRMLEHLNHPFLCNLRYSFQDVEYLYIVVDLMNGGDLRFHISRKTFTEDAVRFWIAELGCALKYIHSQGIVHRDVKPDNILLDGDGHVHLADFNVASDFTPGKQLSSRSGTLAYLAPEVYEGKGYSSQVDWWGLGVTFYECIYNKRPFSVHRPHEELARDIMRAQVHFPPTNPPVSTDCIQAMDGFMDRDRRKRLGAADFDEFTVHPFFACIDFNALEAKRIEPVFQPSADKTNFDATYDLEELLLEEAPLEARARRQKPREQLKEDATDKEIREDELHRMIEKLFEPFDYTTVAFDRYPGTIDPVTSSVGEPPDWVRPSSEPKSARHRASTDTGLHRSHPYTKSDSPASDASPPIPRSIPHGGGDPITPPKTAENTSQTLSGHHSSSPNSPHAPPAKMHKLANGHRQVSASAGGGVSVVLDEAGNWSHLADRNATSLQPDLRTDAEAAAAAATSADGNLSSKKPAGGMLGFFSRKRGRGHSPKPQERGVLGRDGARHIIH
ncbi:MAG: hypothetical protein M1814_001051 [Vezdaea aestivalis]|nr:MAG: hypothetical protein M1814_001051 [Vezdaea aestivalis]